MDTIVKALNADLPFKLLVLLGIAYGCYVLAGVARVSELHLARAACESAQLEAARNSFGSAGQVQRKRLEEEAEKICAKLKDVSRP
ncbi:hypothetical protein [Methylibium petroleiphilum]|nr:hypothetical protein [Methylibium petroleiphilum]